MTYKQEMQMKLAQRVQDKLKAYPDFIKEYFVNLESAKTQNVNFGYLKHLFDWLTTNKIIEDVTADELCKVTTLNIINYLNSLKHGINGCELNTAATIETKKKVINAFWNYLMLHEHLNENPLRKIPRGKFRAKKRNNGLNIKVPSKNCLDGFISNVMDIKNEFLSRRNLALIRLFIGSGIRSEELIGLDLDDLYLNENPSHITIMRKGEYKDKSQVLINSEAKENILRYLEIRNDMDNIVDEKALFLSTHKTRLSKSAIDNIFRKYSQYQITPHMLRHWVGTQIYNKTGNILDVREQLGHESHITSAKYYIKRDINKLAEAIENL